MLAYLRFRRLPYQFVHSAGPGFPPPSTVETGPLPLPKVVLLPMLWFPHPDGTCGPGLTDSTPLIRMLDTKYTGRPVVPADPALAFLDALIEDWADEWLTKCMYSYRWQGEANIANAARLLPHWSSASPLSDATITEFGQLFAARQVGRLAVIGCSDVTQPLLASTFQRLLAILNSHLSTHPFLLGHRPSACDFAMYGQLHQLVRCVCVCGVVRLFVCVWSCLAFCVCP